MKNKLIKLILPAMILYASPGFADDEDSEALGEFKSISIVYEENVTDSDAEVVIKVKAFAGMKAFSLIDPSGKEIVKLKSKDLERIGLEQFLLESAEPSVDLLKSGFPEGVYQFRAKTFGGEHLYGERYLSHYIAPVVELSPCGEVGLPVNNVILQWALVNEAASYEIEIEQDELEVNISAALDGSTTQFTVPPGFLLGGTTYEVGVTSVTDDGNKTVSECVFSTAG